MSLAVMVGSRFVSVMAEYERVVSTVTEGDGSESESVMRLLISPDVAVAPDAV